MLMHTFKVKQDKSAEAHEFTTQMPASMDDDALIIKRYGSVERMIDRANSQWTVDVATGMRKRLPNSEDAQEYADTFCADGRKQVVVRSVRISKDDQEAQGFTEAQLAFMAESGISL